MASDKGSDRGLVAVGAQIALMNPADGNGVFVADVAAERAAGRSECFGCMVVWLSTRSNSFTRDHERSLH